jgi:hypothetical protein
VTGTAETGGDDRRAAEVLAETGRLVLRLERRAVLRPPIPVLLDEIVLLAGQADERFLERRAEHLEPGLGLRLGVAPLLLERLLLLPRGDDLVDGRRAVHPAQRGGGGRRHDGVLVADVLRETRQRRLVAHLAQRGEGPGHQGGDLGVRRQRPDQRLRRRLVPAILPERRHHLGAHRLGLGKEARQFGDDLRVALRLGQPVDDRHPLVRRLRLAQALLELLERALDQLVVLAPGLDLFRPLLGGRGLFLLAGRGEDGSRAGGHGEQDG